MSKKVLFGSIAILFAAAAVFNINLLQNKNAGDISLDAITIMAEAQNGEYVHGTLLTNWKTYEVECFLETTTITTSSGWGIGYNNSGGVSVPIPNSPLSISASASNNGQYGSTKQTSTSTEGRWIIKMVCGYGAGFCLEAAPKSGHPCS